jgi:hypothetical protein
MAAEKNDSAEVETVVDAHKVDRHEVGGLVMPDSLVGLSDDEYHRIGRKATVKMDIIIMVCYRLTITAIKLTMGSPL